jgi:hypothetical protein
MDATAITSAVRIIVFFTWALLGGRNNPIPSQELFYALVKIR